jgi:hypothetical protein
MFAKDLVPYTCRKGNEFCTASYLTIASLTSESTIANLQLADLAYYGTETYAANFTVALEFYKLAETDPKALFSMGYMY